MSLTYQIKQLGPLLRDLWAQINPRRRVQLGGVLGLMVLASFAEVLSLGAVIPFLGVLTAPNEVYAHPKIRPLAEMLGVTAPSELLLPLTLIFGAAALLNGSMRLALLWSSTRLSVMIGADLSIDMYRRTLHQPYALHIKRNSSEIINAISTKSGVTIYILQMAMNLISSVVILFVIVAALLFVDTAIALIAMAGFGVVYALVIRATRKSLLENGERVARETNQVIKVLQEGLGGIRDVLLEGTQAFYCQIYRQSDLRARIAQGNSAFLTGSPRFAVEAIAMLLIAGLAYYLARRPSDFLTAIPVLGALTMGAQRMLPVMQQAYSAWAGIKSSQASLADALALLEQPLPTWAGNFAPTPLPFARDIQISNLSFRYAPDSPWVLQSIDLAIPRGARIGFIGTTGSGKSTLIDIFMGLLSPSVGNLRVDELAVNDDNRRAWQVHLAHVPQTVFLADATVEENIAFGLPRKQIDHERVRQAAHKAQIAKAIESWPEQYNTMVGERGVRLSGGQRQRIGIARALYKKADVIIFDEATSALDNETERAVMDAIEALDSCLTILIIAHRLTTLRNCDRIYELKDGCIAWAGAYDEIAGRQRESA